MLRTYWALEFLSLLSDLLLNVVDFWVFLKNQVFNFLAELGIFFFGLLHLFVAVGKLVLKSGDKDWFVGKLGGEICGLLVEINYLEIELLNASLCVMLDLCDLFLNFENFLFLEFDIFQQLAFFKNEHFWPFLFILHLVNFLSVPCKLLLHQGTCLGQLFVLSLNLLKHLVLDLELFLNSFDLLRVWKRVFGSDDLL